jgi:hypothetical protein
MAKKAAQSGASHAAAAAYNAAKTLINATGTDADAMSLAQHGRAKAKDVKLRALAAAKAHPPSHKLLPSGGGGAGKNSLFKLKGHDDEGGFSCFLTRPSVVVETDEEAEHEDYIEDDAAISCGRDD